MCTHTAKAQSHVLSQPLFLGASFCSPKDVWGLERVGYGDLIPCVTPLPGKSNKQGQRCPTGGPTAVLREGVLVQG